MTPSVWLGLVLGFVGVGGLVFGSASLFQATQLSLINIRSEATLIRERQTPLGAASPTIQAEQTGQAQTETV